MSREVANIQNRIVAMSENSIGVARKLETVVGELPQLQVGTHHIIHGGLYARTIMIPEGSVIVGALVKIPTILIIQGDLALWVDGKAEELHGYNIFAASANRKQAVAAIKDTYVTMLFSTNVNTVEEAENQFTDEVNMLFSRKDNNKNIVIITGE